MNLFSTLTRKSPVKVFACILLGAISGVVYSLLIPLLMEAVQPDDPRYKLEAAVPYHVFGLEVAHPPIAMMFGLACALILVSRTLSQVLLTRIAMLAASDFRMEIYERIRRTRVATLERLGSARLFTTISSDIPRIITGSEVMPELLVNVVTLLGMLGFLFYLNADVLWFVLESIGFGIVTYELPMVLARRYFVTAGNKTDALQKSVEGLINGIKELKLNDEKSEAYFESELIETERALLAAQKVGNTIMKSAVNYGDMICFMSIGVIVFVLVNYHSLATTELIGVVMALLYITGPIAVILNMMPYLTMGQVSLARVVALLAELPDEQVKAAARPEPWNSIRLRRVCYQHQVIGDTPGFQIGPFDLEFRKGEITFIVGGNGSGKSTLCKLLTLHYRSSSGEIYFGDHLISDETIGTYRQDISAIYSNYHLFERIFDRQVVHKEVEHFLTLLNLNKKVTYQDGKFSTLSLSDGQRRRLALVVALLENRKLYLFDEWAADQDPEFKEVFYVEILPWLKAKGMAVVVITHDDRYFDVADNVITLSDGIVRNISARIPQIGRREIAV